MADYMPVQLRIGGAITRKQFGEVERLTAKEAEVSFDHLLEIWKSQACGGAFEELEAYLIEQQIAFDRYSEPALGYDGRLVHYRPGMEEPVAFVAGGNPPERMVRVSEIQAILDAYPQDGPAMAELLCRLRMLCGPVIALLPKFRVLL